MVLIIDNYDSFVYNLGRYVRQLGFKTRILRSDAVSVYEVEQMEPVAILLSPGPCTPDEAGISVPLVQALAPKIPILGICLGHQAIVQAFGGTIKRSLAPTHGTACTLQHTRNGLFQGLPPRFRVARYHSLVVSEEGFPPELLITSYSSEREIMSIQHTTYRVFGVQFHPESILTEHGYALLKNFFTFVQGTSSYKFAKNLL